MRAILTRDNYGAVVLVIDPDGTEVEAMEVYGKALGFQRDPASPVWTSMARAQPADSKPL